MRGYKFDRTFEIKLLPLIQNLLLFVRDFETGDIAWFLNGKLNVCYNCVDRHVRTQPDKVAIIHEGNEPGDVRLVTYRQLLTEVCRMANVLKSVGVRKGDSGRVLFISLLLLRESTSFLFFCSSFEW